jgi:hypothetical protein
MTRPGQVPSGSGAWAARRGQSLACSWVSILMRNLLRAIAGLRLLGLEVDRIDVLPMLPTAKIFVGTDPADLFLADSVLGHARHELATTSFAHASDACQ